jgi:hypothetical protein
MARALAEASAKAREKRDPNFMIIPPDVSFYFPNSLRRAADRNPGGNYDEIVALFSAYVSGSLMLHCSAQPLC